MKREKKLRTEEEWKGFRLRRKQDQEKEKEYFKGSLIWDSKKEGTFVNRKES